MTSEGKKGGRRETTTRENEWLVGMEEKGTWRRYVERKERKRFYA